MVSWVTWHNELKITAKTRYINEAFNLDILEIKRTSNTMIKKAMGTNISFHELFSIINQIACDSFYL